MTPTEKMWTGRLTAFCKLLLLALLLHPGGEGAVKATPNFKVIGNSYARAGGTTSLTCQVVPHQDYPSFKWARNGMIIPYETDKRLSLVNVTKQDAGYYQCGTADSAINGEGRLLHVFEVGDRLPAPDIDPAGQPVCGRTFALKCIFLQNYIPSVDTVYTWYKDDREIKDQCNQTLSFARVDESDAGAYTCTAWEGDKTTTTSPLSSVFNLTPLVSPKVTINKVPLGARVKGILGGNFSLNCEVTEAFPSVPVDGYTWSVSRSSETQNRSLGEHGRSLYLGPLTTDHRGRYFCEARTNKIFRNLTLAGHASVTVDVVYLDKLTLTSDQKVNKGDHVTLTCAVDSHPTARLAWIVNGQEVRHVTDNVDHYFIRSAACSDSNNYTCAASNPDLPGLKINATVQLTVLCEQATAKLHPTESLPTTANVSETGKADVESVVKGLMAAAICFGLLVVILAAVVGVVCWRRRNGKSAAKVSSPGTGEPENKTSTPQPTLTDEVVENERKDESEPFLKERNILNFLGTAGTWLDALYTNTSRNGNKDFEVKVSNMASSSDGDDPPTWLATPEQASVLHCTDKFVHLWGPPGSGKTRLLVDRVRRWLKRDKTIVLAVCDPFYELLLHHLDRMVVSRVSEVTSAKVTLCTDQKLLKKTIDSLGKNKNTSNICVAVDAIEAQFLPTLLEACSSSTVECVWTTSRADFPESEFKKMGGRSVLLQYSLRCPGPVLRLANGLLPAAAKTAPCKEFRLASASQTSGLIRIESHAYHHLPASPVNFDCGKCNTWLKALLRPQKTSPPPAAKQWQHWIILLTGDWGPDSQMTEKLVTWLRRQGVPAVHEWQPDCHVSNLGVASLRSSGGGSSDKEDRAATRVRVESSEDKEGHPAVHVMRGSLFRGLEKPCVLVVHYDWRDDRDAHKMQQSCDARLAEHRQQLHLAMTCCQTELAVLFLSPSPAAAPLIKYTSGGEQHQADAIEELEAELSE